MTVERIDIVVREDGSRVVRRNLEDLGDTATRSQSTIEKLKGALAGFGPLLASMGIGFGIAEIIRYTDTWANLEGRLRLVTTSSSQLARVQTDLFNVAQRTRSSLEATIDLHARVARSTENLNVNDSQRLRVTEAINKAVVISGSTATSAAAALMQLGQGFASGTLRGEELNSVMEQTPRLAEAIAAGMGKTIGQLRAMGQAGLLTSEQVFKALESQSVNLQNEFAKMPITIGQSFTVLTNELMKFIGTANTANGNAKFLSDAILLVSRNIDVIMAAMRGLLVLKVSEFFLNSTVAIYGKITAMMQHSAALRMDTVFEIASAEAKLASTSATLVQLQATQGAIVASRAEQVTRLGQANANIQAARASMAAASAAGAQSFALAVLRTATAELAVAEAARTAALAALAVLGGQQARVTASLTAATAAQTAAQAGLTAAQGAGAVTAGLATRALGFLGGPIGIITTVLSLGAAAWALWGNKAVEVEQTAAETVESKTAEIIANLDKQIAKLEERNRLAQLDPTLVKGDTAADEQKRSVMTQMNAIGTDPTMDAATKTEILRVLGSQYNDLTMRADRLAAANDKATDSLRGDKLKEFMGKYATSAEARNKEIAEWKKTLGDMYSPEVEKRINEKYKDPVDNSPKQANRAAIQALEMRQKLEKAVMEAGMDEAESLARRGLITEQQLIYKRLDLKLFENSEMKKFTEAELALAGGKDQQAARARFIGELALLEQQRKGIITGTENQIQELMDAAAQKDLERYNASTQQVFNQAQSARERIETYGMLPAAITASAIAQEQENIALADSMGAEQTKLDAMRQRLLALQQLQGFQQQGAAQELADSDVKKIGQEWADLGNSIANSMTAAFGKVGKAVGTVVSAFGEMRKSQADITLVSANRMKAMAGYPELIAKEEVRAAREGEIARVGAYANMAGAAKNYFEEGTAGYKVMQTVENGFRTWQMAMELKAMYTSLTSTAAKTSAAVGGKVAEGAAISTVAAIDTATTGISISNSIAKGIAAAGAGVAQMFAWLGPWAWPAIGAMVGTLALFGINAGSSGGTGPTAEDRQKTQGSGTVLGDSGAKSESIGNSLKIMELNSSLGLGYQNSMLEALRNIESALSGAAKGLLQTTGLTGGSAFGSQNTDSKNFFGSDKTSTIADTGVRIQGSFGALRAGRGTGTQYEDINKTSDGGWFHGDKAWTERNTKGLGSEQMKSFALIFDNMGALLTDAGVKLGGDAKSITNAINTMTVDFSVSLRNLQGQELTDALNAGVSVAMDKVTTQVFPFITKFQKMGEGLGETLVRVATEFGAVESVFNSMGKSSGKLTGYSVEARDRLVELSGGLEAFANKAEVFMKGLYSEDEQRAASKAKLNPVLAQYGLTTEGANAQRMFRDFVKGLDATTVAGAKTYAALMDITPAFLAVTDAAASERRDLLEEYNELTKTSTQLMKEQRDALDPANRALFDQINAVKRLNQANEDLRQAYNDTYDAGTESLERLGDFAKGLRDFTDDLKLGDQSIMTPQDKYEEARKQYDAVVKAAQGGDVDAQGKYQDIAREFLKLSETVNASGAAYTQDYQRVLADAKQTELYAVAQIDVGRASLEAMRQQAGTLLDIEKATMSVAAAITAQNAAQIDVVQTLFKAVLGRAPTDAQQTDYRTALANGTPIDELTARLQMTPEYGNGVQPSNTAQPSIDYNTYGTAAMAPLTEEIKRLNALLADKEKAQAERDADIVAATFEASELNAQMIREELAQSRRSRFMDMTESDLRRNDIR
jgi:tape measure domain-containing protein